MVIMLLSFVEQNSFCAFQRRTIRGAALRHIGLAAAPRAAFAQQLRHIERAIRTAGKDQHARILARAGQKRNCSRLSRQRSGGVQQRFGLAIGNVPAIQRAAGQGDCVPEQRFHHGQGQLLPGRAARFLSRFALMMQRVQRGIGRGGPGRR